jgi:hypothetical protein
MNVQSFYNPDPRYPAINIVGEIINQSRRPILSVKAIATAYESKQNNQVLGVGWNWAAIDTLRPGFKTPYGVSMYGNLMPLDRVYSYNVSADWKWYSNRLAIYGLQCKRPDQERKQYPN